MTTTYRKIVKGYTAQARFYAQYMERPEGDWKQLGWMRDRGGAKPVFELLNGTPVAIFNSGNHLSIVIQEVAAADILATEAACYAEPVENTWNRPECPGDIGTMGHLKGGF